MMRPVLVLSFLLAAMAAAAAAPDNSNVFDVGFQFEHDLIAGLDFNVRSLPPLSSRDTYRR